MKKAIIFSVLASEEDDFILFKPKDKLALNRHYSLKLDLGENKTMQAYFLSVEDPEIVNIFPLDGRSSADSKITIVFNRPIVPLTTLEELEDQNIPVEIHPATEGKFKWISTNTCSLYQEGASKSSHYTVK